MIKITFGGNKIKLIGDEIKEGDKALNFIGVNQDLSPYDFYTETKGMIKILSVSPSLDTGVCSLQTIRFNEEAKKISDQVKIITITVDLPFAQKRYTEDHGIDSITVISDYQKHDFSLKYGFLIEGLKLISRGIIIIDKNNKVRYVEYVQEVTDHPDYDKAIEIAKSLI